jgi:predicted MFS family arabinose efflux permease
MAHSFPREDYRAVLSARRLGSLGAVLAVNRTVGVVLVTLLFLGLGEQLWTPFLPAYLEAKIKLADAGAAAGIAFSVLLAVGVYACLRNLFEALCYVAGGRLTARLGDRGSLILFGTLTVGGYALFLAWDSPVATIVATLLIVGWDPLSVPVTFTTVGATVTRTSQGMAFAVQSIQKRLPKILGPVIAGVVLAAAIAHAGSPQRGHVVGMRWLVTAALVLSLGSLAVQIRFMPRRPAPAMGVRPTVRSFHPTLRRLLLAEVFTRWGDWLVRELVVLYLLSVRGVDPVYVGVLFAVQHVTALVTYLPIGRMTAVVGLQPFIGLTFVFFALFPLALAVLPGGIGLFVAFVVYGLREIGEPARKALITSLFPEEVRAEGIGLYWGVRSVAICWASLVGALVWYALGPEPLLYLAFAFGCAGATVFYLFAREPLSAGSPRGDRTSRRARSAPTRS